MCTVKFEKHCPSFYFFLNYSPKFYSFIKNIMANWDLVDALKSFNIYDVSGINITGNQTLWKSQIILMPKLG